MKTYDHTWLISEWERMGFPDRETSGDNATWHNRQDSWHAYFNYRIKCKPYINWDHAGAGVVAMATDECGETFLYYEKPDCFNGKWDGSCSADAAIFASFTPGTCAWQDSLVMRPVVIGEEK